MNSDDLNFGAVNWEHGMLLSPEHFLRQERYLDSRLAWLLRYGTTAYGLIGGGPRLADHERGAQGDDPIVHINDDSGTLGITVSQCRGITPNGSIIDISTDYAVSCDVPKESLAGVDQARIYVVCEPGKSVLEGEADDTLNPEGERQRRNAYSVSLKLQANEVPYALAVGCIVRSRDGLDYDRDAAFIPACTFLGAHSTLIAGARKIIDDVIQLASRFTELHRAMRQFIVLFKDRDIESESDLDVMSFVGRMVVALQNCVYEIVDTSQSPQSFFGHLRRVFHSAAVYLDLSPPVRQYFDLLKDSGETEFIALLAQQKKSLGASPKWKIYEDLSFEIEAAGESLDALRRLERALEGKYIDFRVNPILDAMNFIFDRDGQVLYKLHSKSSRMQGSDDGLSLVFAKLQLEGKEKYRLVLVGEDNAVFGEDLKAELYINENTAYSSPATYVTCKVRDHEQRNFEFDFETPQGINTITDLRVVLAAEYPIKVGLLFVRQRFYRQKASEAVKPLERETGSRQDQRREERFAEERGRAGDAGGRADNAGYPPRLRDRDPSGGHSEPRPNRPEPPPRHVAGDDQIPQRRWNREPDPRESRDAVPPRPSEPPPVPRRDTQERTQRLDSPWPGPDNPPRRRRLG